MFYTFFFDWMSLVLKLTGRRQVRQLSQALVCAEHTYVCCCVVHNVDMQQIYLAVQCCNACRGLDDLFVIGSKECNSYVFSFGKLGFVVASTQNLSKTMPKQCLAEQWGQRCSVRGWWRSGRRQIQVHSDGTGNEISSGFIFHQRVSTFFVRTKREPLKLFALVAAASLETEWVLNHQNQIFWVCGTFGFSSNLH